MVKELNGNHIVSGYRFSRQDPLHRVIISKFYNLFIRVLFGIKLRDINSGFKLIKKEVIDDILKNVNNLNHCVMSEFIIMAYLSGYMIKEVPVRHSRRKSGKTVIFHPAKLPFIMIELIFDILKMRLSFKGKK
jgi:transcriptional regulator of met regulon